MKPRPTLSYAIHSVLTFLLAAVALPGSAQQPPSAPERAAMLKATMAASQVVLKQYEWIETTVVSLKGQEKSRKQERCYYGADGGVQKVDVDASPEPKKKGGLRGKLAAKKKEELTDYMQSAVSLVKSYVPPSPAKIQAAKDAGKVEIDILQPGKTIRLNFRDYEKPGDSLGVQVDLVSNRPQALTVATYLDDPKDIVTLEVQMGQLNDGTTYPAEVTLNATAKKLTVSVKNSGYRKSGN